MTAIALALLWCSLSTASAAAEAGPGAGDTPVLIVAPGGEVRLESPEDGARVEAAFDGGALRSVPGSIAAPGAGDHWLAVASRDRAGNLSPIHWLRVRVDGSPPRVELEPRPPAVAGTPDRAGGKSWLPPGGSVAARGSDDLAGVAQLTLAAAAEAREVEATELTLPLPAAGEVVVRASAVDRVGNRSSAATLTLWVDGEPPAGEIRLAGRHLPGPVGGLEGAVLAPSCRLEAAFTDEESGLAGWVPWSDGVEVTAEAWGGPWTAGHHTVAAVAVDRVGNEGRLGPYRLVVDGAGPEITWRVLSAGVEGDEGAGTPDRWYLPPVEVAVEAVDAVAGLEELRGSLDGAAFEAVDGPVVVDGDRLYLEAVDRVGNRSTVEARWRIDRQPPEIRVAAPGARPVAPGGLVSVVRGEALDVRAVDRGAGVASATYVMNRGWPVPPPARPLPERLVCRRTGRFELTVKAVDRLGNASHGVWQVTVRRPGEEG